jgi:hypothetical protein
MSYWVKCRRKFSFRVPPNPRMQPTAYRAVG